MRNTAKTVDVEATLLRSVSLTIISLLTSILLFSILAHDIADLEDSLFITIHGTVCILSM